LLDCLRGTGAGTKIAGLMKGNGSSSGLCTPLARFDEGGWEQVSAGLAGSIGLEANKIVLENILGSDRMEANKIELENIFGFASIKPSVACARLTFQWHISNY
jgi:hypothetical protein